MREHFTDFARHYLLALRSFTCLPVGPLAGESAAAPRSAGHFPGVGLLVGIAACMVFAVTSLLLPANAAAPFVAGFACTLATILMTGARHEDALADAVRTLADGTQRLGELEIGGDGRLGSAGVLALMLAVGTKVSLLAALALQSPSGVVTALLAGQAVSRFWPLVLAHTLDAVAGAGRPDEPLAARLPRRALAVGALWCVLPLVVMALAEGAGFTLVALAASGLALAGVRAVLQRRFGGFTPTALGAAQQACEVAFYFGAAVAVGY